MGDQSRTETLDIELPAAGVSLPGFLTLAAERRGLVVFTHGSGSSRFSSRNRFVAERLNEAGLSTLLFDLLTARENERDLRTAELRFDIELLTRRLIGIVDALAEEPRTAEFSVGLFGASTGAAAALGAAAARPARVGAVVSRGGRPDLAPAALPRVEAPTLLIVGGLDTAVIALNREAAAHLQAPHRLDLVDGATHLFEEPGTLERVAELASDWFVEHLAPQAASHGPQ